MTKRLLLLFVGILIVVAACAPEEEEATPAPIEPTVPATVTSSPSPSPTEPQIPPTPTFPPTITPTLSPTPAPPTGSPTPTFTPGPFEHQVRAGEDCIGIVYQYGHVDLDVLSEFYALNNLDGCNLPGEGATVRVPRPTGQAGDPVLTQNDPPAGPTWDPNRVGQLFYPGEYCVEEEDTLTSVALKANTSLRRICELNPLPDGIDCRGCDFSQSDTGSCPNPPVLSIGQCLTIPAPTPFPTATGLPSGDETATPTPTLRAPYGVYPTGGETVTGPLRLQWVSAGLLQEDEFYVVSLTDETDGNLFIDSTKSTYMDVPAEYAPADGQPHSMKWHVSVELRGEDGLFVPIGGRSPDYDFIWE